MANSRSRYLLLGVLIIFGLLASSCVPIRLEASWPALSQVENTGDILLTYNDRIVMIDPEDGQLVRLRNADGEVRLDENGNPRVWEFTGTQGQARQFYSKPVQLDAETLLIATYNSHNLYEVDVPSARIIDNIQVNLPGQVLADLVQHDNMLYVGISERNLLALDSNNLQQRWQFDTQQGVWAGPVVADDVLYFASLDHFLYALNPDTGEEIWKRDLEGAAPGKPFLHNGDLYIGSFARKLFRISAADGAIVAEYPTQQWVWSAPVVDGGTLYAADLGGNVYALDISGSGFTERWQTNVTDRGVRAAPLVTDDYVIVGARDHKLYWLSRETGRIVQDEATVDNVQNFRIRELAGEILSDMMLVEPGANVNIPEPYIVASSVANQELLVAFRVSNGERIWSYGR